MSRRLPPTRQDLIRWSEALARVARTGLGFTQSLYERERFEEVMAVAGDIRASAEAEEGFDAEHFVDEWMKGVGEGVAGYITPKECVGEFAVFVSRIRKDPTVEHGLNMWVVSDNLRKGAALNAVQIAQLLHERGLIEKAHA